MKAKVLIDQHRDIPDIKGHIIRAEAEDEVDFDILLEYVGDVQ